MTKMIENSQTSLQPKSREHDNIQIVAAAIKRMMQQNDDQRERHLGMVQKMLDAAATGKGTFSALLHKPYQNGAGVNKEERELDEGYPTRKHFKMVADTVRAIADPVKRQQMANHHAEVFSKMNPRFDHARFHAAAGTVWHTPSTTSRVTKEEFDLEVFDNQLNDCLEKMGFNEENKQTAANLFFEAVEQRLFHSDDDFRAAIGVLLKDYAPSPFLPDQTINAAELLANKIEQLQNDIENVETQNAIMNGELRESLREEPKAHRLPKKSSIEECLNTPDEDNADALFNEGQNHVADPMMRKYLETFR
jgi:hypothetical protein